MSLMCMSKSYPLHLFLYDRTYIPFRAFKKLLWTDKCVKIQCKTYSTENSTSELEEKVFSLSDPYIKVYMLFRIISDIYANHRL